jgi:hypothetical protein
MAIIAFASVSFGTGVFLWPQFIKGVQIMTTLLPQDSDNNPIPVM